ncbi:unnamed protein product [Prunus armeniaca]
MEVYVNDMLVKSVTVDHRIQDVAETFEVLKRYKMRLNPAKCAFGDLRRSAKPNRPCGCTKLIHIPSYRSLSTILPSYKGEDKIIDWTPECEHAFQELKEYMGKPPLLSKPKHDEDLLLYLSVSSMAISSVLIREVGKVQHPVYYISRALQDVERSHSLRQILQKPETSGRLIKWSIEQGEFGIIYCSREAIKAQAVADFLSEFTNVQPPPLPISQPEMSMEKKIRTKLPLWILHVDGASNQQGSGAGLVLTLPEDDETQYALWFGFKASNNEAGYEALLAGLCLAFELGVKQLSIFSGSQLAVNHVTEEYQA